MFIEKYVCTIIGYCVSELHGHTCPYRNVLPEAVYVCFARFVALLLLVSEIAKCIA